MSSDGEKMDIIPTLGYMRASKRTVPPSHTLERSGRAGVLERYDSKWTCTVASDVRTTPVRGKDGRVRQYSY